MTHVVWAIHELKSSTLDERLRIVSPSHLEAVAEVFVCPCESRLQVPAVVLLGVCKVVLISRAGKDRYHYIGEQSTSDHDESEHDRIAPIVQSKQLAA